jgi:hypothetical protein
MPAVKTDLVLSEQLFYITTNEAEDPSKKASLRINDSYIELTLKANGKAELYFHAYFWTTYLEQMGSTPEQLAIPEVKRMKNLSTKPKQVLDTIDRFPFGEEEYNHFVGEFGGRKPFKKVRLIEQLQRCLFVAQIVNNEVALHWIEKTLIQLLGYFEVNIRD